MKKEAKEYLKNNVGKGWRITFSVLIRAMGCTADVMRDSLTLEGTSFRQIRMDCEMEYVLKSLDEGLRTERIAMNIGYKSPGSLYKPFKDNFNLSPKQYLAVKQ